MANSTNAPLLVWFDGDCPVCRQEVALYRRMDRQGAIEWIDIIALTKAQLPPGKNREDLLGRFHARPSDAQGEDGYLVGVDAFAAIWWRLPWLRRAAFLFKTPGIRQLVKLAYLGFLKWQRHHRARRQTTARHEA